MPAGDGWRRQGECKWARRCIRTGLGASRRRMLPPRTKSFIDLAVDEMRRHLTSQLALLEPQGRTATA